METWCVGDLGKKGTWRIGELNKYRYWKKYGLIRIYQASFEAGMEVFRISRTFPREEVYSLTDQIRRSSRSVSGNLAEAWRKRRYSKSFVSKLSDVEGEAAETQVWLDYALACDYISEEQHAPLFKKYDSILGMTVTMITNHDKWTL